MIISQVFGSKKYKISEVLIEEYGESIAFNVLKKTGPKILSIASDEENALTLGIEACKKLLKKQGVDQNLFLSTIKNLFSVLLTVPTGMPLLKIDPVPDVYAILLSSIASIKLSFIYLISPELFPLPITIA